MAAARPSARFQQPHQTAAQVEDRQLDWTVASASSNAIVVRGLKGFG